MNDSLLERIAANLMNGNLSDAKKQAKRASGADLLTYFEEMGWSGETASRLIAEAGSIRGLAAWAATDYRRIKGIGRRSGNRRRQWRACTTIPAATRRRARRTIT